MPRNVRNFFIEIEVDGRKSLVRTGPVAKGGGFFLTIRMREDGEISPTRLEITGNATNDGLGVDLCSLKVEWKNATSCVQPTQLVFTERA